MEEYELQCPYCWESIVLEVDLSAGAQTYTEDCSVCCQPILVRVRETADGGYAVEAEREND
jgi:cytochrome c1